MQYAGWIHGYWVDTTTNATTQTASSATTDLWGFDMDQGTASTIWHNWATQSAAATQQQIWAAWTQTLDAQQMQQQQIQQAVAAQLAAQVNQGIGGLGWPRLTEEQERQIQEIEAQRARQQEEYRRQAREREAKQKEAQKRAEALLARHLSPEQLEMWCHKQKFIVVSQSGKRYEVVKGRTHNLYEIAHDGKRIKEYCVHVAPSCPDADNCLVQKLMLETMEEQLLKQANGWIIANGERLQLPRAA